MSWIRQSIFSYGRSSHKGLHAFLFKKETVKICWGSCIWMIRIPHNDAIVGLLTGANNLTAMETWPHSINMAYSRVQHGHSRVSVWWKSHRYLKKLTAPPATSTPSMLFFHTGAWTKNLLRRSSALYRRSPDSYVCNYFDFSDSASKNWLEG